MIKLLLLFFLTTLFSHSGQGKNVGGIDAEAKTITLTLSQEPRSLNSLTAESVSYTAQLMVHLNEGLMRYDKRRKLVGGVAESWRVSNTEIRFKLRANAKWQNGDTVSAEDFVFAWQQLVRPDTGSPSANLASPILNAAKIIRGALSPNKLGVEAISPTELLIKLEHPCAWCLKLMTSSIFYPINRQFFDTHGETYGSSKQSHLSNGAFQVKNWQRGKQIRLSKNEHYWGHERVKLAGIHFDYIGSDAKTKLNLFRAGEIATVELDRETIPDALDLGLRLKTYPTGHLYHIQFSHIPSMLSANMNLRKAISLVIDKDEIVNRVVASPGTRRADSLFHDWLTVGNKKFITERPPTLHQVDITQAKKYLSLARTELGLSGPIKLTLTINDSNLYRRIAEYLHQALKIHLDIELLIDPQITQMMVEKWRRGTSDMTLITWPVDVDDPMDQISFMGNPDFRRVFNGLYSGKDMAALYTRNKVATTIQERLDSIQAVQNLFEEKVTIFPLFESYGASSVSPKLNGFVWQPVRGYADYRYAQIK